MGSRIEQDSFGPIEVPAERYWGAQTQRSLKHFAIGDEKMPAPLLRALVQVKRAAAKTNQALGVLAAEKVEAIVRACDEMLSGGLKEEFPLSVWQTGSGTQTNMNVNEVLARRGGELGGVTLHPNDDVNKSQSSNDVFPAALNLAVAQALSGQVVPRLLELKKALDEKAAAFGDVVKIGRTHLQDATPVTLGQELSGWSAQLAQATRHLESALPHLYELALGGTAVGTGLNAPKLFAQKVAEELAHETWLPLVSAPNKFEALSASDAVVHAHGALKGLAAALFKIANDVRWLGSGPRAGLGELLLPENEPGSSIMPGKVNPTQCEALTMVCVQVFANDAGIGFAGASGNFQLNVFRPYLAHAALQTCRLLADAMFSFRVHCIEGLEPNRQRIAENVSRSLMLVTALNPHIGYDAAAKIAKDAHARGVTLREAAVASGAVTAEQFDQWVKAEKMV